MRVYKAQSINRTDTDYQCSECGDVIEPEDYYITETWKNPFPFIPDEKFKTCVGCYETEKEVNAMEVEQCTTGTEN